ncbi:MAG: FecR domain-containing protein [Kiritimatiellia bacterium]|nr:FecR domain-containing protein [Kiritimatiellia bacterium]
MKNEAVKRAFDGLLFAHFGSGAGCAAKIMGQIMADAAGNESKRRVMEGIFAVSASLGNDAAKSEYFVNNVMNEIKKTKLASGAAPADEHKNIFTFRILSLAASLMILLGIGGICLMAHYSGGAKGKPAARPCLLTSTPGGLLERNSQQSVINNGMQIEDNDTIMTYAGSCSFVTFSDLSRIEIGGGSTINFSEVSGLNRERGAQPGDRKMCLREGVIDADILGSKNHGAFNVSLPGGELSTRNARFIAAASGGVIFVEVSCGSVSLKPADGEKLLVIEAGHCLALSKEGGAKIMPAELPVAGFKDGGRFTELKKQLSLSESKFEELLVNFQKRKKADICLDKTIKNIKRRGANYS